MSVKLIGGLAALAIAVTGCSAIGGAGSAPTWKPTYATSTVATSTVAPTAVQVTPPGIGVPVRNGSLEFTVYGTRTATAVYDQFGGHVASAEGAEHVIVKVSVRNIDTQAVHFFPDQDGGNAYGSGLTVLIPNGDGFQDVISYHQMLGQGGFFTGVNDYYGAELIGPVDGAYTIRQVQNTCEPNCAQGTLIIRNLHWNGREYVALTTWSTHRLGGR